MKVRTAFFIFLTTLLSSLYACSDNDDKEYMPSETVAQAFIHKYPNAKAVEWTQIGNYTKAEFSNNNDEVEAWFYTDGTCLLAISQIAFSSLPEEVSSALAGGLYATWTPDNEAEIFEPALGALAYIIEVGKTGSTERELYYTATGELHKEVSINYDGDDLPLWMGNFVKQHYSHAITIQGDQLLDERYSTYILYGKNIATIWFSRNQTWEYTSWPVAENEVPTVVLDVLKAEAYQGYAIRSVEYRENPSENFYYFDLYKTGSLDLKAKITPEGQVLLN